MLPGEKSDLFNSLDVFLMLWWEGQSVIDQTSDPSLVHF